MKVISNAKDFFGNGGNMVTLDGNFQLVRNEAAIIPNAVSTMRHDEQLEYDTEMIGVARQRLSISALLRSLGLVKNLGGMGVILSMWQREGDFTPAQMSMSGRTRADQDKLTFDDAGVPIPIFHKEFELDHRRLQMSRRLGQPLDTDSIGVATRVVADAWETHLFLGAPQIVVNGSTPYGFLTHPDRNTLTLTATWATTTGANIMIDVLRMITALNDDNFYGPFIIMVAKNVWLNLSNDFKANGDKSILERILAIKDIKDVVCADYMTASAVVMFQATKDVVDLAIAQDMDNIPWQTQPLQTEWKVFMAGAIRVKSTLAGKSGIVHGTP